MTTRLKSLRDWVAQVAQLTSPDRIHWCDGSDQEYRKLLDEMLDNGTLVELNQSTYPGCYLHRSDPEDVARVEHLTFVCTKDAAEAGPNNNWKAPDEAKTLMDSCFAGCMRGRTMYVIPYCMGPIDSPYARCGVEITDSAYVVANMYLMTRIGKPALKRIEKDKTFVKGLHSTGELDPKRRYIVHFPEELTIMSYGSGYGGNALLGKKCHALRIASYQARTEGWLAEHMLIVGVQSPAGDVHYLACAFPSACGKTNLAMLIPPASQAGWKVWTLGDDIAWMHLDANGQLRAINPEAGVLRRRSGNEPANEPQRLRHDRQGHDLHERRVTSNNDPWWEEKGSGEPTIDWKGNPYTKANGPAAHPNARFTVSAKQNPSYSNLAEAPEGVPISALVFGGRRRELAPLVYQAKDWAHGVLVGASVASETTAAGDRQGRRHSPRSDGHEAVLRLQLRRLLGALAVVRQALGKAAEDLPRQLVPARRERQIPLAGLRRQLARVALDHRPLRGQSGGRGNTDRLLAQSRRHRRQGPRCVERDARSAARGRSGAMAQGDGEHRRIFRRVRRSATGRAEGRASEGAERARLSDASSKRGRIYFLPKIGRK
jgi:phosphoenolpyruvate carboxykinase (GTP)